MNNRLYKKEKLCSLTAIDRLFGPRSVPDDSPVASVMAYPWRAVWIPATDRTSVARFLISVPKKRLRHAVDRVKMRRRCREAYRLGRPLLPAPSPAVDIAFIYVANTVLPYGKTERAMAKMLSAIARTVAPDEADS